MFDPTVFENMKVVLEGSVYDRDLNGPIHVTGRKDLVELSVMARSFAIRFSLKGKHSVQTEISITAELKDLAAEILEQPDTDPGCILTIRFFTNVNQVEECAAIHEIVTAVWGEERIPRQTLSFIRGKEHEGYSNEIAILFDRKITERQIDDIPDLIEHTIKTLRDLQS